MTIKITKHAIDRFKQDVKALNDKEKMKWDNNRIQEFLTKYAEKAKHQKLNIMGKVICRGRDSKVNNTYKYYHWYMAIVIDIKKNEKRVTTVMHKKSIRRIKYEKFDRLNSRISHIRYLKKKEKELINSFEV